MPSTTQAPSPTPRRRSWARNNIVLPEPATLCTWCHSWAHDAVDPRHPWACSAVVLPEPTMPLNLRCPWSHNVVVLPKPARLQYCIFFFVILGLKILILIYYIATLLWYSTLLLFCYIALMCYIATFLWYATLRSLCACFGYRSITAVGAISNCAYATCLTVATALWCYRVCRYYWW
jgi:hypothetical protein